jgi:hypothetical protein
MDFSEISEKIKSEDGGILIDGGLLAIEIDRRIVRHKDFDPVLDELFHPKQHTLSFEGEFKTVYMYRVPDESDIKSIRPFSKRGMSGACYQMGSIGHQICVGPKWVQSGANEVLKATRHILQLFLKPPNLTTQALTLGKAVYDSVKSGSFKVSEETFQARKAICLSCEYYDPSAFMGTGRCRVCGCGVAKLQMPHQECPKGKWGKV